MSLGKQANNPASRNKRTGFPGYEQKGYPSDKARMTIVWDVSSFLGGSTRHDGYYPAIMRGRMAGHQGHF